MTGGLRHQLTKRLSLRPLYDRACTIPTIKQENPDGPEKESTEGIHRCGRPPQFEPNRWPDPQERP